MDIYRKLHSTLTLVVFLVGVVHVSLSQELTTTVGFQAKFMVPTKFVDSGGGESASEWLKSTTEVKGGYVLGMVIRKGFTKSLSLETGINYVKRNIQVDLLDADSLFESSMNFGFINYQIPVKGLIYTRLTENLWMNASGGCALNFAPSDVETSDGRFAQATFRLGRVHWFNPSLIANYGFEWRTKKDGFFYLGASYDRPFKDIAVVRSVSRRTTGEQQFADAVLTGAFLTIDLRYFFHEDPERRRKIKKSPK